MEARYAQVAGGGGSETSPAVLHAIRFYGPLTINEVCTMTKLSRRDVEAAVESLRLAGEPIVGGNDGLHLTEDPVELENYVEARRRRMASIYLGSRALRRTARRLRERVDLTLFGAA